MITSNLFLLITVILGFICSSSQSFRFELQSGQTKCISEDIRSNSMTVGKYNVVHLNQGQPVHDHHKVTVRVTSGYGNTYHLSEHVESGEFGFTAVEEGDYRACFTVPDHKPQDTVTLEFDWRTGIATKDWTNVAKKNQIDAMEMELRRLQDIVTSVHDEMFYLREREEEMQDLNRSTNSTMAWLSFLSLLVCASVAGLQLWHLKTFFEKKKII